VLGSVCDQLCLREHATDGYKLFYVCVCGLGLAVFLDVINFLLEQLIIMTILLMLTGRRIFCVLVNDDAALVALTRGFLCGGSGKLFPWCHHHPAMLGLREKIIFEEEGENSLKPSSTRMFLCGEEK